MPAAGAVQGPAAVAELGFTALSNQNGRPNLTLYGHPGRAHGLEWRTNLIDAPWHPGRDVSLTNLWETVEVPESGPSLFYRARQD